MMRFAIVGAGLAGVAIGYHLLSQGEVTLFDASGIGGGASGVAPGLLHAYGGIAAKKSWRADDGLAATRKLLQLVPSCFDESGILRLAMTPNQQREFQIAASNPEVDWWPASRCQATLHVICPYDGIFISNGLVVRIRDYLSGLWNICEAKGAEYRPCAIRELRELDDFDYVVLATGSSTQLCPEITVNALKGQVIRILWPPDLIPPPMPLIASKYLVMSPDRTSCLVGATFERNIVSPEPDLETAMRELIPAAAMIYPQLASSPVLECMAGIRATLPNHRPAIQFLDHKTLLITGFGSKGLLYHALFAEEVARQLACLGG